MKTKPKLKARAMWARQSYWGDADAYSKMNPTRAGRGRVRVSVIPLHDQEEVLNIAHDTYRREYETMLFAGDDSKISSRDCMRAALAAIGVLPKQKKGRK